MGCQAISSGQLEGAKKPCGLDVHIRPLVTVETKRFARAECVRLARQEGSGGCDRRTTPNKVTCVRCYPHLCGVRLGLQLQLQRQLLLRIQTACRLLVAVVVAREEVAPESDWLKSLILCRLSAHRLAVPWGASLASC